MNMLCRLVEYVNEYDSATTPASKRQQYHVVCAAVAVVADVQCAESLILIFVKYDMHLSALP